MSQTPTTPPAWIDVTAKRLFRSLQPRLNNWDESTRQTLAKLCDAHSTYRDCTETIRKDGLTVVTDRGGIKAHPLLTIRNQAWAQFVRACGELGLYKPDEIVQESAELREYF